MTQSCGGGVVDQLTTPAPKLMSIPSLWENGAFPDFAGPNEFPALDALKINAAFIAVYYYALYICLTHKLCRAQWELL